MDIDLLNKTSAWVDKHPGVYKLVLEECYKKLSKGDRKILLVDVISSLIWNEGINITRAFSKPLTVYIENNEPGLDQHIFAFLNPLLNKICL